MTTLIKAKLEFHDTFLIFFPDDDNANYNIRNKTDNTVNLRLLCGADLLESFGTPGLWSDEDVRNILLH